MGRMFYQQSDQPRSGVGCTDRSGTANIVIQVAMTIGPMLSQSRHIQRTMKLKEILHFLLNIDHKYVLGRMIN